MALPMGLGCRVPLLPDAAAELDVGAELDDEARSVRVEVDVATLLFGVEAPFAGDDAVGPALGSGSSGAGRGAFPAVLAGPPVCCSAGGCRVLSAVPASAVASGSGVVTATGGVVGCVAWPGCDAAASLARWALCAGVPALALAEFMTCLCVWHVS